MLRIINLQNHLTCNGSVYITMALQQKKKSRKTAPPTVSISLICDSMNQCPDALMQFIHGNLSSAEIASIAVQLQKSCVPDRQVLWTGMTREAAQKWADAHDLQTLTTAMGAYMDTKNQLCPQKQKSHAAWIDYIHGASALFALRISQGEVVTVLSNPPPQRFHPDGNTSFQCIEAPIITGELGNRAVTRIEIAHPNVAEASDFRYQIWPEDAVRSWIDEYGERPPTMPWRKVKRRKSLQSPHPATTTNWAFYQLHEPLLSPSVSRPGTCKPVQEVFTSAGGLHPDRIAKAQQHKRERADLEAKLGARLKAFGKVRKAQRVSLHQQQISATKSLKGKKRKVANRKFEETRRALKREHEKKLIEIQQDEEVAREAMKKRHRADMLHPEKRCCRPQSRTAEAPDAFALDVEANFSCFDSSHMVQWMKQLIHAFVSAWK
ncbi:uncharacterized protein BBA_09201 [Beauveria bassiana ARSEF 2860]|uniref:Uncharacterized protein n=1 Tax=Beauveria bassiana (strain ARSEF 2860) TaxID=655819 RepID=J4KLA5_BEAB2|nr:uncharacterized protein BBA_09201 [Beauveria bassiana ARSEF 2860]EJP61864.1 hypothetical protein BBA_09201 [Beauveria bassiana ARSEF 2860]